MRLAVLSFGISLKTKAALNTTQVLGSGSMTDRDTKASSPTEQSGSGGGGGGGAIKSFLGLPLHRRFKPHTITKTKSLGQEPATLQEAELRLVSRFVTEILYRRKLIREWMKLSEGDFNLQWPVTYTALIWNLYRHFLFYSLLVLAGVCVRQILAYRSPPPATWLVETHF